MGIKVETFLDDYFSSKQLKDLLADMGHPVGGAKKDRIDRIIKNWTSYNRDWYEILDFLDWSTLSQICDDFNIPYSDYAKEETLCNKIEENWVLDFRKKEKSKVQKKSDEKPSINIQGKNINIGSNNKITTKTETKGHSIPKAQLIVAIVVGAFVIFGIVWGIISTDNSTENEFSLSEGFTVETDAGLIPIPQNIRGTDKAEIYPIGDTIIENTLVSNSHGFVISIPNDNWEIIYEPNMIGEISYNTDLVYMSNDLTEESLVIAKKENMPQDFDLLFEAQTREMYKSANGYNFKEYFIEEKNSKVFSYNYDKCREDECYSGVIIWILKKVDSDYYQILAVSTSLYNPYGSLTISQDMYEILNSFKLI